MTDNAELMIRNGTAFAAVAVAKIHFKKPWLMAIGIGAIAYVAMDWAMNLRSQD